jgi:hypothetical protein
MKVYDPKIPLISIHVPKCGGSSFLGVLQSWFGNNLHLHYFDEKTSAMPAKVPMRRFPFNSYKPGLCIHGHFNRYRKFGVDDYYPQIKQAITFLRDPLEITLSNFHYAHKLIKEDRLYREGEKITFTKDIDEYLEKTGSFIPYFFPADLDENKLEWYFSNYFIHVGVIEQYQRSIDQLAEKLGRPSVKIAAENRSARGAEPSASAVKKFQEKCRFEYLFYNYALKQVSG